MSRDLRAALGALVLAACAAAGSDPAAAQNAPVEVSLVDDVSVTEHVGLAPVPVRLSRAHTERVDVHWQASPGTATGGAPPNDDYLTSSGILPFSPGETDKTISVHVRPDNEVEGDEYFWVELVAVQVGDAVLGATTRVKVNIIDDEPTTPTRLTLYADNSGGHERPFNPNVSEGEQTMVVTGELNTPAPPGGATVTVRVVGSGTTATACATTCGPGDTGDYKLQSTSFFIPEGETIDLEDSGIILVTLRDDDDVEGSETIRFTATTLMSVATIDDVTATILDNDGAAPTGIVLTTTPRLYPEDSTAQVQVTAALVGGTRSEATVVTVNVSDGTASSTGSDKDYGPVADFDITIPANGREGSADFNPATVDDDVDDDGTILIDGATTATLADGVTPIPVTGTTVTITDDDGPPKAALSLTADEISEAGGSTTISASLDSVSTETTTITVQPVEGLYTVSGGGVLTIPDGVRYSTGAVTLTAVDNEVVDPGGRTASVTATVVNSSSGGVTAPDAVSLLIADDDTATVAFSSDAVAVTEDGGAQAITVELSKAVSTAIEMQVSTTDGTASSPEDYGALTNRVVRFEAREQTRTFDVTPVADTLDEGVGETFAVTLTPVGTLPTGVSLGTDDVATVTITDDDAAPTGVSLALDTDADAAGDQGGVAEDGTAQTVSVTASLEGGTTRTEATAVTVTVSDGTAGSADYSVGALPVLTIAAGASEATGTFEITPVEDTLDEGAGETVAVGGTTTVGLAVSAAAPVLTITDDDDAPTGVSLALDTDADTAGDQGGVAEDGTAQTVSVTASLEGGTTRTEATAVTVTVSDGTAGSADYSVGALPVLTIEAGASEATGTFEITPAADTLDEGAGETVLVGGTTTVGLAVSAAAPVLTITDDDAAPTGVSLALDTDANTAGDQGGVAEDGTTQTVSVTASLEGGTTRTEATAVTVTVSDGTAVSADYSVGALPVLTIEAGASEATGTFEITPAADTLDEGAGETVLVGGTTTVGLAVSTAAPVLTITDDDAAPTGVSLALDTDADTAGDQGGVAEDGTAQTVSVTASLEGGTTRTEATAVTVTVSDGTAVSPADYSVGPLPVIVIAAGANEATGTFEIVPVEDTLDEGTGETVTVGGATTIGLAVSAALPVLTITDDDGPPTGVALSLDGDAQTPGEQATVTEGGGLQTVTVKASLEGGTTRAEATVVTVTVAAGTATDTTDYAATVSDPFEIEIAAGEASATGTFEIVPVDDAIDDDGETLSVSGATTAGLTVTGAVLMIVDDDRPPTGVSLTLDTDADMAGDQGEVAEGGGSQTVSVTASLDGGTTRTEATVVTVTVSDGTAVSPADYSVGTLPVIAIAAGAVSATGTFEIVPVDDALDEGAGETVTVGGTTTVGLAVSPASPVLTVADDDADLVPSFRDETVLARTWTVGTEIDTVALPEAEGGNGARTYDLMPDLPAGLVFDGAARTVSGTPTAAFPRTEFTWTVTDSDDRDPDRASLTFDIAVVPDLVPSFDREAVSHEWIQNTDIGEVELPEATGGNGRLTYTLAGADDLPEGLRHDAAARILSGTPAAAGTVTLMLTARDADGDAAALSVGIAVVEDLIPSFGDAAVAAQYYMEGRPIDALVLPSATGGNGELTYRLAPAPPAGLTFDGAARTLAGTPTAALETTAFAWTATDRDGDRAELAFTIEVAAAAMATRERLEEVNAAVLPELARAFAASAAEAVADRFGATVTGMGEVETEALSSLAGLLKANEGALQDGAFSWREALAGESFALGLAGGDVAVWGAGDWRRLSLDGPVDWRGDMFAAHLGTDVALGSRFRAGAAVSRSEGSIDYTDRRGAAPVEGVHEHRMTGVHPYVGGTLSDGSRLWAVAGYGAGEIGIDDGEAEAQAAGRQSSDAALLTAAAGGGTRLVSAGALLLDLKGEAQAARLRVADNGDLIAGLSVRTHRLRLALEGSRAFTLSPDTSLTPSLEFGARWDGGDGETGAGVEVGGGLGWADRGWGLTAELAGRVLAAHGGGVEEWGASGFVRLDPGTGGRGLSLNLAPSWGETASGVARLWEDGMARPRVADDNAPVGRIEAELGWGVAALGSAGVLTPYGGAALADDGDRRYRLGGRLSLGRASLSLESNRWEHASGAPEHGVFLRAALRW